MAEPSPQAAAETANEKPISPGEPSLVEEPSSAEETGDAAAHPGDELLSLIIQTKLDVAPLSLAVLPHDVVGDLIKQIFESESLCFLTSFALSFHGKVLPEWEELQNIPELVSGSTLELVDLPYDPRSARSHLRRLRNILAGPVPYDVSDSHSVLSDLHQAAAEAAPAATTTAASTTPAAAAKNVAQPIPPKGKTSKNKKGRNNKGARNPAAAKNPTATQNNATSSTALQPSQPGKVLSVSTKPSLQTFFPPTKSLATPQCLKYLTYSGWNPASGNRSLRGDLFYLEVTTIEGQHHFITAATEGFFVNNSSTNSFDPTAHHNPAFRCHNLAGLLSAISPAFRTNFQLLLNQHFEREPLEFLPVPHAPHSWVSQLRPHSYNLNRAEDALVASSESSTGDQKAALRDWNFDYQLLRDHPTANVMDRLIRECALFKFNTEFVEDATKGVIDIVTGSVPPLNPLDPLRAQMFLYNNIFFSFCTDSRDLYASCGGDITAYKMTNNDIAGLRHLLSLNVKELHTVPTAVVDYKGWRMIAQGVIPGILNSEAPSCLVYGSTLPTDPFVAKPPCSDSMAAVAEKLYIKAHALTDTHGNTLDFTTSPVTKGIVGTDGRTYVLDLFRMTPRDANFQDAKDMSKLVRSELIARFRSMKLSAKIQEYEKQLQAKQAQQDTTKETDKETSQPGEAAQSNETVTAQQELDAEAKALNLELVQLSQQYRFNVDAFTDLTLAGDGAEVEEDLRLVQELATFLTGEVIPSMLFEWAHFLNVPGDGQKLCECLHAHGINLRYLGRLARYTEIPAYIHLLIIQEMAARSAKHLFTTMLRTDVSTSNLATAVAYFLNALVGKAGVMKDHSVSKTGGCPFTAQTLWAAIYAHASEHFQGESVLPEAFKECPPLSLVRRFCQLTGVQVQAVGYQFSQHYPFSEENILDLTPKVKHVQPYSTDGNRMLKAGREYFQAGRADTAYDHLNEAWKIFHQVYGFLHPDCAHTFSLIANLCYTCGDIPSAAIAQRKAVIIFERVYGLDSPDTIRAYAQLGLYVGSVESGYAMQYLLRARYLCELIGGRQYPERAALLTNIAVILQEQNRFNESLEYLQEALNCNLHTFGPLDLRTAATYHAVAMAHVSVQHYREALEFEKQCYNIYKALLGDEDKLTIQSHTWLKDFTAKAVDKAVQTPASILTPTSKTPAVRSSFSTSRQSVPSQLRKTRNDVGRLNLKLAQAKDQN